MRREAPTVSVAGWSTSLSNGVYGTRMIIIQCPMPHAQCPIPNAHH
ncbi:MAG: hypothetical protein V7L05_07470 [Nostoc sp.]